MTAPGPSGIWARPRTRRLAARYAVALVLTVLFLFPIYWLFMISFKTPEEIFSSPPVWYPESLQFGNYAVLFRDGDAVTVWNSLFVAASSTVIAMFFGTICAYSLARFRTGGENLAVWIISQRMIPPIAIVFPLFLLYVWFGWVDTYHGLILLYTAFNLPYVIWMMRGYIEDIPIELEESAFVDGCTRWQVLIKVVFPMCRAGLFATAVFASGDLATGQWGSCGGPPNQPPTASFSYACTDLDCTFDGSASSDADGFMTGYDWDFGDGQAGAGIVVNHDYAAAGTYTVTLTVTDDFGDTGVSQQGVTVDEPAGGDITATVSTNKKRNRVAVEWTGAGGASVDIYRNGALATTTANDGRWNDRGVSSGNSYVYRVCEQGSATACSNDAAIDL